MGCKGSGSLQSQHILIIERLCWEGSCEISTITTTWTKSYKKGHLFGDSGSLHVFIYKHSGNVDKWHTFKLKFLSDGVTNSFLRSWLSTYFIQLYSPWELLFWGFGFQDFNIRDCVFWDYDQQQSKGLVILLYNRIYSPYI
jgi:hypothetical protein